MVGGPIYASGERFVVLLEEVCAGRWVLADSARASPVDVFAWRSVGLVAEVFQGRPYQASSSSSTAVVTAAAAQNERAIVREKLRRAVDEDFCWLGRNDENGLDVTRTMTVMKTRGHVVSTGALRSLPHPEESDESALHMARRGFKTPNVSRLDRFVQSGGKRTSSLSLHTLICVLPRRRRAAQVHARYTCTCRPALIRSRSAPVL